MKGVGRVLVVALFALLPWQCLQAQSSPPDKPLTGMVVVIDPGHGGYDPGSVGWLKRGQDSVRVVEDEYAYDVALRLGRLVERHGGTAVFTVKDPSDGVSKAPISNSRIFKHDRDEIFTLTNRTAFSDTLGVGLRTRVKTANSALQRFPNSKVVFVSIHFDSNPVSTLQGTHFIAPAGDSLPDFVKHLAEEFRSAGYIRKLNGKEYRPIGINGDRSHGLPELVVLRGQDNPYKGVWNGVRQRVLIELGNFSNDTDRARIVDHDAREKYAQLIFEALVETNKLSIQKVRD